jgi:hypothetical protein
MPEKDNYPVGKYRTPEDTRFKPGESGNKRGRPKGSKNRNTMIRKVLSELVTAEMGGSKKKITVSEASVRRLSQIALKGDRAAIMSLLQLWKETEDSLAAERDAEYPFSEVDRQMIEDIYARMKACEE